MSINDLTIGELKEVTNLINGKQDIVPYKIGDNIFIRTVTMYYVGKINNIVGKWIILDGASWICDTGRFHDFLKDGKCNEYEGFVNHVSIPIDSIIDMTLWNHQLFKGQR